MLLIEYRIKLPILYDQYQIAHLYTTMDMSKQYTKPGEGVEVLENTPSDPAYLPHQKPGPREAVAKVQRTSKRYYIPDSITSPVGLGQIILRDSSFNGFPNFRTTVIVESAGGSTVNGEFTIDTVCRKGDDNSNEDNVFGLPQGILNKRDVVDIDIVADPLPADLTVDDEDPKKVLRLGDNWQDSLVPELSMVVYKLVFVKSRDRDPVKKEAINTLVVDNLRKMFTMFHRKLVCCHDRWKDLNMEDIRIMEDETKDELDVKRKVNGGSPRPYPMPQKLSLLSQNG